MTNLLQTTRRHDLTFCRDGRIHISARVARLLGLSAGDAINIACDPNGEYLLYVQYKAGEYIGNHTATCYPSKKGGMHFRCNSTELCAALLDAAKVSMERRQASFFAGAPMTIADKVYIPIIYKLVL